MAGLGDIASMFGKVQELQANMKRMQEEMQNKSYQADSGGGMVSATVNGKGELLEIKIEPEAVDPDDLEMLEDLLKAAVNAAMAKCQEEMKQEMSKVTGGMNIPGMEHFGKMLGM